MKIIDGKKIADEILEELRKEIEIKKLKPCLAVILISDNPASRLYIQKKEAAAEEIGVEVKKHFLDEQISEKEVLGIIDSLNKDKQINGILVQLPLPKHLAVDKIVQAIKPVKDVDGFVKDSLCNSPFVLAISRALAESGQDQSGRRTVILANSKVLIQSLKLHLNRLKFIKDTKKADIVISALGRPQYIKGSTIKPDAVLIDGGISKADNKIVGDVDRESVQEKASWLTPVPGGLGPLTVAFLMKNLVWLTNQSSV
jgi:methylenetetrahydrofolate dehydrogenase (NADP+) / methenyltetrahydrofolate cyclohydrolase